MCISEEILFENRLRDKSWTCDLLYLDHRKAIPQDRTNHFNFIR